MIKMAKILRVSRKPPSFANQNKVLQEVSERKRGRERMPIAGRKP